MRFIMFLLGIITGSFLNVCIWRIPREESVIKPHSYCTSCKTRIKFYDLIPIISYIFLKGRCRRCGENISIKYPFVELITGIIFLVLYKKYGISQYFIKFAILLCVLIVIAFIDYETTYIYDNTIIAGFLFALLFLGIYWCFGIPIKKYFIGLFIDSLISGGIIALIIIITKGMGWGDAEIYALLGAYLGWRLSLLTLAISIVLAGIVSSIFLIFKIKDKKDYIPFSPYILIASIISIFFGEKIILWYINKICLYLMY